MAEMEGGDNFDYTDYMPSYDDMAAYFMDNGQIYVSEECYNWTTSVDLQNMDANM